MFFSSWRSSFRGKLCRPTTEVVTRESPRVYWTSFLSCRIAVWYCDYADMLTIYVVEVSPAHLNLTKRGPSLQVRVKTLLILLTLLLYLTYLLPQNLLQQQPLLRGIRHSTIQSEHSYTTVSTDTATTASTATTAATAATAATSTSRSSVSGIVLLCKH